MTDTGPRFADHARMMQLVSELSPETRAQIAAGMDDRFHEVTGAPRDPGCCGPQAAQPDPQPWRCTSTRDGQRCHYPASHHGRDAANSWDLHQGSDGNEWSDR